MYICGILSFYQICNMASQTGRTLMYEFVSRAIFMKDSFDICRSDVPECSSCFWDIYSHLQCEYLDRLGRLSNAIIPSPTFQ